MDEKLIERLAREAGMEQVLERLCYAETDDLARFAALVAEECAKVAEYTKEGSSHYGSGTGYDIMGDNSAAAIRERFKP